MGLGPLTIRGPVVVLAPHPDDDAIGAGGTIARLVSAGESVRVIYLTSGELGAPGVSPSVVLEWRERDAREAARILGIPEPTFWEYPDGRLRDVVEERWGELVESLWLGCAAEGTKTILAPQPRDAHEDHRITWQLAIGVRDACQGFPQCEGIELLGYEVWTPLDRFDVAVDVTEQMEAKLAAIRAHESQVTRNAFDDAAFGLARYRGALHNRPHGDFAEVFMRYGGDQ